MLQIAKLLLGQGRGKGGKPEEGKMQKLIDTTIEYTKNNNAGCVAYRQADSYRVSLNNEHLARISVPGQSA